MTGSRCAETMPLTRAVLAAVENQLNLVRAATGTPEGKRATPRNRVRKKGRFSRADQHFGDDNACCPHPRLPFGP